MTQSPKVLTAKAQWRQEKSISFVPCSKSPTSVLNLNTHSLRPRRLCGSSLLRFHCRIQHDLILQTNAAGNERFRVVDDALG
jgi:hypothetical protein